MIYRILLGVAATSGILITIRKSPYSVVRKLLIGVLGSSVLQSSDKIDLSMSIHPEAG